MRRASPQGYSGRRPGGGYGAQGRKAKVGNLWEVVSALANALMDARNKLVTLMNTSHGDPMRPSGGRCDLYNDYNPRVSPDRAYSPYGSAGTGMRNVHRGHAHGHCAFGCNSEFPPHPTPARARPRSVRVEMTSQQATPLKHRCTHPLHGMGSAAKSLTPRRQRNWQPQVAPSWSSQCDQLSRRGRACVNITSGKNQETMVGNRTQSPDRRPCISTQFSALLSQEAYQLRQRRLAEDAIRDRRPSWSRC